MARTPQTRPAGTRFLRPVGPRTQATQFYVWHQQNRRQSALSDIWTPAALFAQGQQGVWFPAPVDDQSHVWRHYAITDLYEMWVPAGSAGHYAVLTYWTWPSTTTIWAMGRLKEGLVGTHVEHTDASVTKTGSWGTFSNVEVYGGSTANGLAAGAEISAPVTGSTLGLRVMHLTNAGFGLVAIDGDYTRANLLPAVDQSHVDAGWFDAADIGKRFHSFYASSSSPLLRDMHIPIAEGLANEAHTVTVQTKGTTSGGSDFRVYVAAFVGCTGTQTPGQAGTAMFYTRQMDQQTGLGLSAMDMAWHFLPDSGGTSQWIGANHGNETLDSSEFLVDDAPVTLVADEIATGNVVEVKRAITMTHPDAVGDVASKAETVTGRADTPVSFEYASDIEMLQPGVLGSSLAAYNGMLPASGHRSDAVDAFGGMDTSVVGGGSLHDWLGASNVGESRQKTLSVLSSGDDVAFMLQQTDIASNVRDWVNSAPSFAFFTRQPASDQSKGYFALATSSNPLSVTTGEFIRPRFGWRVLRIAGLYDRLVELTA